MRSFSVMLAMCLLVEIVVCGSASATPVGYWRFEEANPANFTSLYNSTEAEVTKATNVFSAWYVPGSFVTDGVNYYQNNKSYNQNGGTTGSTTAGYSAINAGMSGTQFTVEAFVNLKTGAVHDWDFIVGNYLAATPTTNSTGWCFDIEPGGKIGFLGCQTLAGQVPVIAKSATVLSEGVWHHVAAVGKRVGTQKMQVQMYIDYVADGSPVNIWSALDSGPYIKVNNGVYKFGAINPFDGNFDEVRISDTALSPSQFLHVTSIPEPATVALLGMGVVGLIRRKRKV